MPHATAAHTRRDKLMFGEFFLAQADPAYILLRLNFHGFRVATCDLFFFLVLCEGVSWLEGEIGGLIIA